MADRSVGVRLACAALAAGAACVAAAGGAWAQDDAEFVTLRGRVHSPDGRAPVGLTVFLRHEPLADSAAIAADGAFTLVARKPDRDTVEFVIDAANRAARWYFPSYARIASRTLGDTLGVVLVPRAWVIEDGRYRGKAFEINLVAAFAPATDTSPSFYRRTAFRPGSRPIAYRPNAWPADAFPIPVAFDRGTWHTEISARDSAAFWRIVNLMHADFGQELFRPAAYESVAPPDTAPPAGVVLVRTDLDLAAEGSGGASWRRGRIVSGRVVTRSRSGLRNQRLVIHELMHALGFGHTCAWQSVMAQGCPQLHAARAAPHDVAHVQVFHRVVDLQRRHSAQFGILEALNGQRVLMLGLPPEAGTTLARP